MAEAEERGVGHRSSCSESLFKVSVFIHCIIACTVCEFDCRVLKDVRFSIAPVRGHQTCPLDCSSRVVWIEQSKRGSILSNFSLRSTSSPPAKKRKIEQPSRDVLQGLLEGDEEKLRHDDGLKLEPETRLCVVLSTSLPVMQRRGEQSVTIIATWTKVAGEGSSRREEEEAEVAEIGVATLSCQLLCNGELNLNESCLPLWDGEKMSACVRMIIVTSCREDIFAP